jgi:tripartite-type tricarboxylate transporter receptor subunit TctC
VKELVALARKRPNDLAYASSGNGSGGHLAAELLKSMTGIEMLHIPYKGGGPALVDLISGQVQVLFTTWASGRGHIQSGRIRALAVSTAKRPQAIPTLPTVAESGVPGYDAGVWYALLAPAGTPPAVVERLNREIVAALQRPDFSKMLHDAAIDPVGSSPAELGAYIRSEIDKWAKVVRQAGIRID